jgi:small Trp-rich protein
MYLVVLGVCLLVLKLGGLGPVADWPWWGVLAPFGAATLWWWYADSSGLTKRREMEKMDKRKEDRRRKNLDALGLDTKKRRRP